MKTTSLLSLALCLQLALAAGLGWSRYAADSGEPDSRLLAFDIGRVDRLSLSDQANTAELVYEGDTWRLPGLDGLGADGNRVQRLLDSLDGLTAGWPVADSGGSQARLEVDEDAFQRRLHLYEGDNLLGEYYFGTSPGFRQTHGRRAGENAIYALGINNFDMPADANDWLDKSLLAIEEVTALSGADYALSRDGDTWHLEGLDNGADSLDEDAVRDMTRALGSLRVLRAVQSAPAPADAVSLTVGSPENRWTYDFYSADDTYYVHRRDMDTVFTISKSQYDRLAGVSREQLLKAAPETEAGTADAAPA